jgi:uncharacterized protein YndB with AHSA1/START domain
MIPGQMIELTLTRSSTASIETVFDAMTDHRGIADYMWWCRRATLDREGTPAPNGVGAVRRLVAVGPPFVEEIIEYERPTRYAYKMLSGAPTTDHIGTIELRETATGTEVSWHLRSTLKIPGIDRLARPAGRKSIDGLLKGGIALAERRASAASSAGAASLTPADESFFTTADLVLPASIDLPHSPAQVWEALTDDRLGAWMPIVDRARWADPPPRSRGARRSIRLLRRVTIDEEFHIWENERRLGFRALDIRPRIARGWAEQAELEPLPAGGTRLTYTVAIDAPLLRFVPIPGFLTPVAAAVSRRILLAICMGVLGSSHDAEDAAQDASGSGAGGAVRGGVAHDGARQVVPSPRSTAASTTASTTRSTQSTATGSGFSTGSLSSVAVGDTVAGGLRVPEQRLNGADERVQALLLGGRCRLDGDRRVGGQRRDRIGGGAGE